MKKILLTGITGQVGQELEDTLSPLGQVIGVGRSDMDLAEPESIRQVIHQIKPDVIVNAAAYTAVDKAETELALAKSINAVAPTIMAEEAQNLGAILLHISTDYVFDGKKNTPYTEQDTPNPIGSYGKSKLQGEEGVEQKCDRNLILRTAWVYGTRGHGNFVKTMLRLGAEREELRVVADQVGTPTWAKDIAVTITQLLQAMDSNPVVGGIYHFTNSGVTSWYDFAVAIFEEAKLLGFPLKLQRVVPITTPEYPTPAQRPAYSVLSNQKISQTLGTYPPHWRQSLRQMLAELYHKLG
ncbi:dTDP-4-dehydrorhamnose reductase [Moorena sp. SIO4A5]|uniref:dTDP-4-dehydrorhamnose reductase n=1 Tax=Moorena sp. SIO4A5 TaxID=2607838 RepID=UPI0013C7EF83|nr:dTDP-4-dehydrorhamnose reductase [Moorena sp. SIO4A5]NEO21511.1 dTDP-4-dehydrorhamnose reductase [Moorena sp. SIO4A5]